eukprot:gb/GECG01004770.1/.p1 GENE.gb/GECG01004770.1/~~gb/GECG01004770.1/.p1  ORF type:complete len:770 (+),score=79.86 gb/GECG01004770.1/:1-2310(+)
MASKESKTTITGNSSSTIPEQSKDNGSHKYCQCSPEFLEQLGMSPDELHDTVKNAKRSYIQGIVSRNKQKDFETAIEKFEEAMSWLRPLRASLLESSDIKSINEADTDVRATVRRLCSAIYESLFNMYAIRGELDESLQYKELFDALVENDQTAEMLRQKGNQAWRDHGDFHRAWAYYTAAACYGTYPDPKALCNKAVVACGQFVDSVTGRMHDSDSNIALRALFDGINAAQGAREIDPTYIRPFIYESRIAVAIGQHDRGVITVIRGIEALHKQAQATLGHEGHYAVGAILTHQINKASTLFDQAREELRHFPLIFPIVEEVKESAKAYDFSQHSATHGPRFKKDLLELLDVMERSYKESYRVHKEIDRVKREKGEHLCREYGQAMYNIHAQDYACPTKTPKERLVPAKERLRIFKENQLDKGYFTFSEYHMKLDFDSFGGLQVVAPRNIMAGEVLQTETPIIAATTYPDHVCDYCMSPLQHSKLTCQHCNDATYCSKDCQENAWKYFHRVLCGRHEGYKTLASHALRYGYSGSSRFGLLVFRLFAYIAQQHLGELLGHGDSLLYKRGKIMVKSAAELSDEELLEAGSVNRNWLSATPEIYFYLSGAGDVSGTVLENMYTQVKSALTTYTNATILDDEAGLTHVNESMRPLTASEANIVTNAFRSHPLFSFRQLQELFGRITQNSRALGDARCLPKNLSTGACQRVCVQAAGGALVNHSPQPNMLTSGDDEKGSFQGFVACRNISEGEPLTISYGSGDHFKHQLGIHE